MRYYGYDTPSGQHIHIDEDEHGQIYIYLDHHPGQGADIQVNRAGTVDTTKRLAQDKTVLLDFDKDGKLIGIEII